MPLRIVRNDITKMNTDAIVNTANPEPAYGGGSDYAVYQAAGEEELLAARAKIGRIGRGEAAVTDGFHLPARYIIHTVGPSWKGGLQGEESILRDCYRNSLAKAKELGCESVAFPLISSGVYGFPKDRALNAALSVFEEFLSREEMLIYLVIFGREALEESSKLFDDIDSYIDDHYVAEAEKAEYVECANQMSVSQKPSERRRRRRVSREDSREREDAIHNRPVMQSPDFGKEAASDLYENIEYEDMSPSFELEAPKPAKEERPVSSGYLPSFSWKESSAKPSAGAGKAGAHFSKPAKERKLEDVIANAGETFQEQLFRLIDERGMTSVEVYKRANMTKQHFSKILSNKNYQPKKSTVLSLALALRLNLDETKDLLARAGYAIAPCNHLDLAIEYFIEKEYYDIVRINIELIRRGIKTLDD